MRPPLDGTLVITQLFGGNPANEAYITPDGYGVIGHDGIDIAAQEGQDVFPAYFGTVEVVDSRPNGFGLHAIIHVSDGRRVLYGHLSAINVRNGGAVTLHEPFAKAGSTGNSTGPHVHFKYFPANSDKSNGYYGGVDPISSFDHDVVPHIDLHLTNI